MEIVEKTIGGKKYLFRTSYWESMSDSFCWAKIRITDKTLIDCRIEKNRYVLQNISLPGLSEDEELIRELCFMVKNKALSDVWKFENIGGVDVIEYLKC